jgi:hypothetical protein
MTPDETAELIRLRADAAQLAEAAKLKAAMTLSDQNLEALGWFMFWLGAGKCGFEATEIALQGADEDQGGQLLKERYEPWISLFQRRDNPVITNDIERLLIGFRCPFTTVMPWAYAARCLRQSVEQ